MPTCPHCNQLNTVKNGHTRPVHTDAFKNTIIAALQSRISARGAARVFGIHRDTARALL